ncbi:MAG: hypothetical protein GY719_37640 [bacterium]|nr:hypothetical protein [bacterium]
MNRKRPSRILPIALLILLLALPAQAIIASVPVIDVSNLIQNILQVVHAVTQISHLIDQLETMQRNLERIEDPNWRELGEHFLYLDELAAQGEALTYADEEVFDRYRALLEGFRAMEPGHFEDTYGHWTTVALDTFAATLSSASAQALEYETTQEQLDELREIADSAEGNLEALNASNMLQGHIAQETAKLNQMLAAQMSAQNVYYGVRLNTEANREATARSLVDEAREEFHPYTGVGGFTGIPADWPYPCYGCARDPR